MGQSSNPGATRDRGRHAAMRRAWQVQNRSDGTTKGGPAIWGQELEQASLRSLSTVPAAAPCVSVRCEHRALGSLAAPHGRAPRARKAGPTDAVLRPARPAPLPGAGSHGS